MESVQLKRKAKAAMLPDYLPWIEGALANGQGAKDFVFTTTMVWAIDAGAYGGIAHGRLCRAAQLAPA